MEINDLNSLSRDENQNKLYDLTEITFNYTSIDSVLKIPHTVQPNEEMRIDLICDNIYNNLNNISFLLKFNNIDNPLNIMSGDIIYYIDESLIELFRIQSNTDTSTRNKLLNANKSTKKDPNRQQYIESNFSLPPTYLNSPSNSVKIEGSKIVIGDVN